MGLTISLSHNGDPTYPICKDLELNLAIESLKEVLEEMINNNELELELFVFNEGVKTNE